MFYIKISVKPSRIHGLGLFAAQDIKKEARVYESNPELDLMLSNEEFKALREEEKSYISHYGYFDKKLNKWHLAHDDIRFCNHSKDGNLTLKENKIIAKRDIKKEEELTQDYSEFEDLRKDLK